VAQDPEAMSDKTFFKLAPWVAICGGIWNAYCGHIDTSVTFLVGGIIMLRQKYPNP
jgi:hypothetical protein